MIILVYVSWCAGNASVNPLGHGFVLSCTYCNSSTFNLDEFLLDIMFSAGYLNNISFGIYSSSIGSSMSSKWYLIIVLKFVGRVIFPSWFSN